MLNLQICFTTEEEYNKAVNFVANHSEFYGESNDEWKMLVVECSDQQDADANEKGINEELIANEFDNYYFEIETN
jgi:hypothetical protein